MSTAAVNFPVASTSVLPPSTPVPAKTANTDFLHRLGSWLKDKFVPAAKVVEKDVTVLAEVAEPFIDVAVPGIAALYHTTLQMVISAQAAAGEVAGTGAAKLATVTAMLEPIAIPYLKSIGVSNPTTDQVSAYIDSVVKGIKIFQVETAVPAALPAPTA